MLRYGGVKQIKLALGLVHLSHARTYLPLPRYTAKNSLVSVSTMTWGMPERGE